MTSKNILLVGFIVLIAFVFIYLMVVSTQESTTTTMVNNTESSPIDAFIPDNFDFMGFGAGDTA
tara:strand:+ start:5975 stop:6166 length:192 start_codon:yes stop_codon:yes gene_type:complete